MKRVDTCLGPLLWYPVDDDGDLAALVYCGCCGDIFMWLDTPDDRHADLPVLAG